MTSTDAASQLIERLWQGYLTEVPYARTFVELAGGRFTNDHIAFRSLGRPGGGIEVFAPIFEGLGWQRAGSYEFPDANIQAIHLSSTVGLPRIFLSELRVERLSTA